MGFTSVSRSMDACTLESALNAALKMNVGIPYRALKSHALSVRLTETNSILRSHAETIISHAFEIPCSFSEVPL